MLGARANPLRAPLQLAASFAGATLRTKIPVCTTTRVKSATVFSLMIDSPCWSYGHEANTLLGSCSVHRTDKPWRRTD
jgi:hypothetical protein